MDRETGVTPSSGLPNDGEPAGRPMSSGRERRPSLERGDAAGAIITKGEIDPLGDTVLKVHVRTDNYVIYSSGSDESEPRRPRYSLSCEFEKAEIFRQRLTAINGSLNRLNDLIAGMRPDGLSLPFYSRHYRSLVDRSLEHQARAMQQAFSDNAPEAKAMLDEFRAEVEACRDSRNKMRYIFANAVALLLFLVVWWIFQSITAPESRLLRLMVEPKPMGSGAEQAGIRLIDMLTLGAIGAFFAVSIGIKSLRINNSITIPEMLYAGVNRTLIGVIAAGIVFLLISGGWILAGIDPHYKAWSIYLFALLAGFSELLVPNALTRVEETAAVTTAPTSTEASSARHR
jgi:hypothetical protein